MAAPNENIHNFRHIVSSWRAQIVFQKIAETRGDEGTSAFGYTPDSDHYEAPAKEGQQLELTPGCKSAAAAVGMWG